MPTLLDIDPRRFELIKPRDIKIGDFLLFDQGGPAASPHEVIDTTPMYQTVSRSYKSFSSGSFRRISGYNVRFEGLANSRYYHTNKKLIRLRHGPVGPSALTNVAPEIVSVSDNSGSPWTRTSGPGDNPEVWTTTVPIFSNRPLTLIITKREP